MEKGTGTNDGIFVDDATSFHFERRYGQSGPDKVDALITSGNIGVGAAFTATVSAAGTITGLTMTNAGSGYSGSCMLNLLLQLVLVLPLSLHCNSN